MKCDQCGIPDGGFCPRHGIHKSRHWVYLCHTRDDYRERWDAGVGPGQIRDNTPEKHVPAGPGTYLKRSIERWQRLLPWLNLSPYPGCQCNETARLMDIWGVDGCRKRMESILDRLEKEAEKRRLSIPFRRSLARLMVLRAIRRART
jgi:hypothetical protein